MKLFNVLMTGLLVLGCGSLMGLTTGCMEKTCQKNAAFYGGGEDGKVRWGVGNNMHGDWRFDEPLVDENGDTTMVRSTHEVTLEDGTLAQVPDVYEQCIGSNDGDFPIGWEYLIETDLHKDHVKGFPGAFFGKHPYNHGPWIDDWVSTDRLPIKVSAIQSLMVSHNVMIVDPIGDYNLTFDLWFMGSDSVYKENITNEVMINLIKNPQDTPLNMDTPIIGWQKWNFFRRPHWKKPFMYNSFSYGSVDRSSQVTNLKAFINYLTEKGFVSEDEYLVCVILGSEPWNGSAKVVVKTFDPRLTTN